MPRPSAVNLPHLDEQRAKHIHYLLEIGQDPTYIVQLLSEEGIRRLYMQGKITLAEFEQWIEMLLREE